MFTGLIEQLGKVIVNQPEQGVNRLIIEANFTDLVAGESIAVNGVCLTLLPTSTPQLSFDLSPETLKLTSLKDLKPGDWVNLERALLASSRFGGHIVTGHVDTTARVNKLSTVANCMEMVVGDFLQAPKGYLLPKGSITLDGINLTINEILPGDEIQLMLIPHTLAVTTFKKLQIGQRVNVEFDYFSRIIAQQLQQSGSSWASAFSQKVES